MERRLWILTVSALLVTLAYLRPDVYRVASASMQPALRCAGSAQCSATTSDLVLVNRFAYRWSRPKRGDVVVFRFDDSQRPRCNARGRDIVKRIVGIPGDHLERTGSTVRVARRVAVKSYRSAAPRPASTGLLIVPEDHYFVLGDNPLLGCDSRTFGAVPFGSISGEVVFIYWPLDRVGRIPQRRTR